MGEAFIRFENVEKIYGSGEGAVRALHDASFTIGKGEICVIVGPSGAGKTTLLNILGGMDTLTSGRVFLNDREVSAFDRRQLADYRRRDIGFVFQFYNLIPNLTALENVELASQIVRDSLPAPQVLTDVGLGERMRNFPAQLSGGEQQRVAIARALAKKPSLLLCHGQADSRPAAGSEPEERYDRRQHHASLRAYGHGRPRHRHPQRHRGLCPPE